MSSAIMIKPQKCIGCSNCALTCSLVHQGLFNPERSHIRISRHDFSGTFELRFSSTCISCGHCARACPTGALQLAERMVHAQ